MFWWWSILHNRHPSIIPYLSHVYTWGWLVTQIICSIEILNTEFRTHMWMAMALCYASSTLIYMNQLGQFELQLLMYTCVRRDSLVWLLSGILWLTLVVGCYIAATSSHLHIQLIGNAMILTCNKTMNHYAHQHQQQQQNGMCLLTVSTCNAHTHDHEMSTVLL